MRKSIKNLMTSARPSVCLCRVTYDQHHPPPFPPPNLIQAMWKPFIAVKSTISPHWQVLHYC